MRMVSKGGAVVPLLEQGFTNLGANTHLVDARGLDLEQLKVAVSQIIDQGNQASLRKGDLERQDNNSLSAEQLQRAKTLGVSGTRLQELQEMISLSRAPILGIDDKIKEVHRAWEYLHSIIDAIRSDGLLPTSQKNIPKIGIRILIQHFFTKEKVEKGIPFVCGYFMDNANDTSVHAIIDRIHILGLLHFWKNLGDDEHILFGTMPHVDSEHTSRVDIFLKYTGYKNGQKLYYTIPHLRLDNTLFLTGKEATTKTTLPNVFPSIATNIHTDPMSNKKMVEHYETLYIIGGFAHEIIGVHKKGLEWFLNKHHKALSQVESLPWDGDFDMEDSSWEGAREIFEKLVPFRNKTSKSTPKVAKKKSVLHAKGRTPAKTQSIAPILPERVTHSHTPQALPKPTIYGGFSHLVATSGIDNKLIGEVVTNFPPNSKLIIDSQEVGDITSHQEGEYQEGDHISLEKVIKETTYTFSFVDLDPDTATQRPISDVYKIVVKPRQVGVYTPKVQKSTTTRAADTLSQPTSPVVSIVMWSNSAEDIALALLEQLELQAPGGYHIISDGNNIILSFSTIEGFPNITVSYEQRSRNMILGGIGPMDSSLILESIGSDLMAIFEAETKKIKELETQRILTKLSPITQLLSDYTGDIVTDDATWSLISSRKNDSNGVNTFRGIRLLEGSAKSKIIDPFVASCQVAGVEIYPEVVHSKEKQFSEMRISVSLRGEQKIAGSIMSTSIAPYYIIDIPHVSLETSIRSSLEAVLLEVLTLLAMTASVISSDDRVAGFRVEKLEAIAAMDGTVARNRKDRTLTPDEEKSMQKLITRLDRGKGKIQCSRGVVQYNPEDPTSDSFIRTDIISRNIAGSDTSWPDLNDNTLVIMSDDMVASAQSGQRGHTNIWRRIRKTERLQKSLLPRVIATVKSNFDEESNISYRGKSVFKNGMNRALKVIWDTLDDVKKQEFSDLITGTDTLPKSLTQALKVIGDDNITIIESFLSQAAGDGVQLIYRRPSSISVGRLKEYRRSMPQGTASSVGDD